MSSGRNRELISLVRSPQPLLAVSVSSVSQTANRDSRERNGTRLEKFSLVFLHCHLPEQPTNQVPIILADQSGASDTIITSKTPRKRREGASSL